MSIDWERFAARVPAGIEVKYPSVVSPDITQGVLLENKPYRSIECPKSQHGDVGEDSTRLLVQRTWGCTRLSFSAPLRKKAEEIIYLIDDKWLTFEEVMA